MKKIFLTAFIFLASITLKAQIYMHFQEPTVLPSLLQKTIISEFNLNCTDAYTYRWTIAESSTQISSEQNSTVEKKMYFNSRFMAITAYMFEFKVLSEGSYNAENDQWTYVVTSFEGTCN